MAEGKVLHRPSASRNCGIAARYLICILLYTNFLALDKGRLGHIGRVMRKAEAQKLFIVCKQGPYPKARWSKERTSGNLCETDGVCSLKTAGRLHRLKERNVSI